MYMECVWKAAPSTAMRPPHHSVTGRGLMVQNSRVFGKISCCPSYSHILQRDQKSQQDSQGSHSWQPHFSSKGSVGVEGNQTGEQARKKKEQRAQGGGRESQGNCCSHVPLGSTGSLGEPGSLAPFTRLATICMPSLSPGSWREGNQTDILLLFSVLPRRRCYSSFWFV